MREEGTTRPSSRAVQRLASDVGGEVSDLRTTLRRALVEADRHEAAGRPERAVAVLAEQREVLAAVHRRLEDRLADAAVEREAEGVLAAAGRAASGSARSVGATGAVVTAPADDEGMGLRLLASATAAFVGLVLLLAPETGGMLTVAGWSSIEEGHAPGAGRAGDDRDPDAALDESTAAPTWPVLHDLAIPEATELRPDPVPDDPARGQGTDRTGRSPSAPAGEVLDELGGMDELAGLVDLANVDGDGTDQETDAAASEDDDAEHEAGTDGSPPSDVEEDSRSGSTSEDESVGTTGTEGGSPGPDDEDDTSAASDGDTSDAQDDQQEGQQDEPALEGSSTTGLGDVAPSDDQSTGAAR